MGDLLPALLGASSRSCHKEIPYPHSNKLLYSLTFYDRTHIASTRIFFMRDIVLFVYVVDILLIFSQFPVCAEKQSRCVALKYGVFFRVAFFKNMAIYRIYIADIRLIEYGLT